MWIDIFADKIQSDKAKFQSLLSFALFHISNGGFLVGFVYSRMSENSEWKYNGSCIEWNCHWNVQILCTSCDSNRMIYPRPHYNYCLISPNRDFSFFRIRRNLPQNFENILYLICVFTSSKSLSVVGIPDTFIIRIFFLSSKCFELIVLDFRAISRLYLPRPAQPNHSIMSKFASFHNAQKQSLCEENELIWC